MEDCIASIYRDTALPKKAVLLTFDDGYIDHFSTVFPILKERKIQGCFFPSVRAIKHNEVLDVNKIHFILAAAGKLSSLLDDVYSCLDEYRSEYDLKSNEYYYSKFAKKSRFDSRAVIFIKHLLQKELKADLRKVIINRLFAKYVSKDEADFSKGLYMNLEQLRHIIGNGMYVGGHGYDHCWFNALAPELQEKEVDLSIDFLKELGSPIDNWVMSYPYGAYNDSLISILKKKDCKLGLTSRVGVAKFTKENMFKLERLDTNDLPKERNTRLKNIMKGS
ncbi:MAG: polysaccharide deacetylase family protein [Candidatus Omnitrophica bacterium]|nr:polysaccharide deacetylase family protein [Candidatus Omnitrophota bacterium]